MFGLNENEVPGKIIYEQYIMCVGESVCVRWWLYILLN